MSIFLDRKIKHEIFVEKIHFFENKTWLCFGTSCMQNLVPVCLLPCAILLICLFDRLHANFLLGAFVLCINMQRNFASKTSAAFDGLSCCCALGAQAARSMQRMFKPCSWWCKDFCARLFSSKTIVLLKCQNVFEYNHAYVCRAHRSFMQILQKYKCSQF